MGAPTFDFSGQVVLVTGGGRGMGAGIVRAFLEAGASVMTCGLDEPEDQVEGATFVTADVRQAEQARLAVDTAAARFGRLDVLVNLAAGTLPGPADAASPQATASVVAENLLAPFYCAQAAQRIMVGQAEGGAIVHVAGVSAIRPSPGRTAYGAATAGLISLASTLAVEWAPLVRVSCISVDLLETAVEDETDARPTGPPPAAGPVPPGRTGAAEDVASACLYLASPAATSVTGAHLVVRG